MKNLNKAIERLEELVYHRDDHDTLLYKVSCLGICAFIPSLEVDLFEGWEHHTGSDGFPIPINKNNKSVSAANYAFNSGTFHTMWVSGPYAELRWDLVHYALNKARSLQETQNVLD